MLPALLVLLTNTVIEVPPSHWKLLEIRTPQHGTVISCRFEVTKGSSVQLLLTDRRQAQRFTRGRSFEPLYSTGFHETGHFRYRVRDGGDYVLIVDNRIEGRFPAEVAVRIDLATSDRAAAEELPPARRRAVVALSVFAFGLIVAFSARQFLKVL